MSAPLPFRKKLVFGLIVAAIAVIVFFGGCELILRVFGFGHSPHFYRETIDTEGHRWLRENRWVTAPYFPPELVRRPQPFRLATPKPANTYRVFVLGSSAAMGDPEPAFSFARMLDLLLRDAYPSIHFEIVNAGITAINSHVVRAIAADCAKLEPDLFIVYEGNNEVIGPYGPATVFSPFLRSSFAIHTIQSLKATRTGQLIAALTRRLGARRAELQDWGGMQMFLHHEIYRDDPRLETTRALFRDNLLSIAESGHRAGASVFLCTVLTNQKDFAPFHSRHRSGLSDSDLRKWDERFLAGQRAVEAHDDAAADQLFRTALALDDHYAELPFQLGRLCLRQNRLPEAKVFFQQALDLDGLRFRTDSALNEVIRGLSSAVSGGSAVVDLAGAAEKQNPRGILGEEFLYEHVHLNFQGAYTVARELFASVSADLVRRKTIAPSPALPAMPSMADARLRLAYTTYEQAMIIKELRSRFAAAPFTEQSDNAERQRAYAARDTAAARLLAHPESRDGLVMLYEQALVQNPNDWVLERNIGMAYVGLGLAERAKPHLERAGTIIPDDADTLFALGTAQRQLGEKAASDKTFGALRVLEPRYPGLSIERTKENKD